MPRLDMRVQHEGRRPRDVRAGHRLDVRTGVRAVGDGCADDAVIGIVVLDLVDAMSVPIVRVQDGLVAIRALRVALEGRRAHALPGQMQAVMSPGGVMPLDAFDQGGVRGVLVEVGAGRRLIHDIVRHEAIEPEVGPRVCRSGARSGQSGMRVSALPLCAAT